MLDVHLRNASRPLLQRCIRTEGAAYSPSANTSHEAETMTCQAARHVGMLTSLSSPVGYRKGTPLWIASTPPALSDTTDNGYWRHCGAWTLDTDATDGLCIIANHQHRTSFFTHVLSRSSQRASLRLRLRVVHLCTFSCILSLPRHTPLPFVITPSCTLGCTISLATFLRTCWVL